MSSSSTNDNNSEQFEKAIISSDQDSNTNSDNLGQLTQMDLVETNDNQTTTTSIPETQDEVSNFDESQFDIDNVVIHFDEELVRPITPPPSTSNQAISNMLSNYKAKINTTLNPTASTSASTSTASKKRKASAPSISLSSFVSILYDMYKDMNLDNESKEIHLKGVDSYINENMDSETKRMKLDGPVKTLKLTPIFQKKAFNRILNKLYYHFEVKSIPFMFPKEMLRFFLATYDMFITPKDFVNTNAIIKSERRSKNSSPLNNGMILQEYVKGFDSFISSMPRSDHNDIKALKFIVENNISIPYEIYDIINNIEFEPPTYKIDSKIESRPDFCQILTANAKHLYILITSNVLLCYDGSQFVIPQSNIEREFTTHIKKHLQIQNNDYVILEVLSATKIKVIDILKYQIDNQSTLPITYSDRLLLIKKLLPDVTIVSFSPQDGHNVTDYSYIHKPIEGFGTSFVYHKSNLIAAAIGIVEKTVVLGFLEDDSTLIVKTKVSISSAVTSCICVMAYKSVDCSKLENPKIMMNGREYKVIGDLNNVRLFPKAIIVELKEGNRLGGLSTNSISKASEYKPITVKKETATLMKDIERRLENQEFLTELLNNISQSALKVTDEQKNILQKWLNPNTNVSFEGYDEFE